MLSREQILNAVWGFDFDPGTKVLEVYIGYLRLKLEHTGASDPIETVRNVGYRLRVRVTSRLLPGGLRAQLALAISLVTPLAVAASLLAVYNAVSSRLRAQIDSELRTQVSERKQFTARSDLSTPAALERAATRFIAAQPYHAESLLIVVQASGARTVSNNAELLAREGAREQSAREATGLLDSPADLATASVAEAGTMRVLATPITYGNRRVGTLRVANPLTPVEHAQTSLRRTFVIVGAIALLAAIAAGIGLASLIAAPLRRMARVATALDAGDLSTRTGGVGGRGEVGVLSDAFDHMLDPLERAFKRQRDFVSDASHELRTPLPCCGPRSSCSTAKPTSAAGTRQRQLQTLPPRQRLRWCCWQFPSPFC